MPSQDRVRANRLKHRADQARAAAGRDGSRGAASEKPAIPALTDVDCHSYRAGHHTHWMQALNSMRMSQVSWNLGGDPS